jgi:hypothetical protein
MSERRAVERLVGRMYRYYERVSGRLPDGKTVRVMEEKARRAAEVIRKKETDR